MTMQKLSLTDCFIRLHFNQIYNEICKGVVCQKASRSELNGIEDHKLKWDTQADKREVLECIRAFFHVCMNADRVDSEYEEIPKWITAMAKIACAHRSHGVVSSYKYRTLLSASEQITKFIFASFDWGINDIDEYQSNCLSKNGQRQEVSFLNSFDRRIWYYTHYKSAVKREFREGTKLWNTAQLLYVMKELRNGIAHSAKNFYIDRQNCLQRLVYMLYDYITIFFMLSRYCKEKDENGITRAIQLSDDIKKKVGLKFYSSDINITIECVERKTNNKILGREGDIRLYKVDEKGTEILVKPYMENPSTFLVTFFDRYLIRMMTNRTESEPSEIVTIDQDFVNGTIVQVNIPPKGTPKPQKISIHEIILYSEKDLPDDVRNLLTDMEFYTGQNDDYVKLARALVLASATNNEREKSAFESTVAKLKDSLSKEIKGTTPQDLASFIQRQVTEIQSTMAAPYMNKADFEKLFDAIDSIYDDFEYLLGSSYNKDMPLVEQLYQNAKGFLDNNPLKIGTTATDEQLKVQKDLQNLEFILSMNEKYPDIIEAEFGNNWLLKQIEPLYNERVDRFKDEVILLCRYARDLYNLIKEEQQDDTEPLLMKYAERLYDVTLGSVEELLWAIYSCDHTLLFWIDQFGTSTKEKVRDLSQKCRDEVNRLSKNYVLRSQLPQMPLDVSDEQFLTEKLHFLRENVKELKKSIDTYHRNFEDISKAVLEKRKNRWGWWRYMLNWDNVPEETKDFRSKMMFESFSDIVSNCSPIQLMQLICYAHIHPFFLSGNCFVLMHGCQELGISIAGLYDEWIPAYREWVKRNECILEECDKTIQDIKQRFIGRERKNPNISDSAVNDQKALQIVSHQIQQIKTNYGKAIPDYIQDIIKAKEIALPNAVKAKFLEKVLEPNPTNPTENLLFIIDAVSRFNVFFHGWKSYGLLGKYITGEYSKRLATPEGQNDFKKMNKSSQKLYLHLLINQEYPCLLGLSSGTRFLLAYQLNFPQGDTGQGIAIPRGQFMRLMSQFRLKDIISDDIQSFNDSYYVINKVIDYYSKQPEQEWIDYAVPQLVDYKIFIKDYFNEKVIANIIENGESPDLKVNYFHPLHEMLKGKSPIQQLAMKYEYLYWAKVYNRHNSGWCEVEQTLFNEILQKMSDLSSEDQQDICDSLYHSMTRWCDHNHCDVIAARLIAIRQFCTQEQFDKYLNDFYKYCFYFKTGIANELIIEGLKTIYNLFHDYGSNVKVGTFEYPSWNQVAILINIHNFLEWFDSLLQEIKAKES